MQFAELVARSVHGVLDHMTGGINPPFIKLKPRQKTKTGKFKSNLLSGTLAFVENNSKLINSSSDHHETRS